LVLATGRLPLVGRFLGHQAQDTITMTSVIGIRREDKNVWERRVPLNPQDIAALQSQANLQFLVQPSEIRVYQDGAYRDAGIEVREDLGAADIIFAVKEIPTELLQAGKIYVYFSHVIKGQSYNMPMLQRLLDLGCSLVDYEKIMDARGRRLIFFSLHAGYAGMIETLRCLGRRLADQGFVTPFTEVRHAYEYGSLDEATDHLREIGELVWHDGLPEPLRPLVIGLAGYGNVSQGCQEILDCLHTTEIPVSELAERAVRGSGKPPLLSVVFKESDMVTPRQPGAAFELQDYYQHPEKYEGTFARHLPHLDVLMNTIYWDERYPRLVTKQWARENYRDDHQARLQVIGDISCDIEGSSEVTLKATYPDDPCYVYDPATDSAVMGVVGAGPVVMAVDNLPCELPLESSDHFSRVLREMVPDLARADWSVPYADLALPPHLHQAVIVHQGRLTPAYEYLQQYLEV
jgi:alpha-aminoadipic semialdehyde synthase